MKDAPDFHYKPKYSLNKISEKSWDNKGVNSRTKSKGKFQFPVLFSMTPTAIVDPVATAV